MIPAHPSRRGALLSGLGLAALPLLVRAADAPSTPAAWPPSPPAPGDAKIAENSRELFSDPGTASIGAAGGDVTIVEFFDYNCPYSQGVEPRVQALLKSDPGVRLILKEFPIEDDARSPPAARAALASARQGKYQGFHQAMLAFHARFLSDQDIDDRAEKAGLDVAALHREMALPQYYDQLIHNMNLARALRIFTTPTFIVDGHIVTTPSEQIDFPGLVAKVRLARRAG